MRYRKKPVVVEATQWFKHGDHPAVIETVFGGAFIETLEGKMNVSAGDWIITGVHGEHYPCKPDIFEKTYELVNEVNWDVKSPIPWRSMYDWVE